jgi:hypothetical protein
VDWFNQPSSVKQHLAELGLSESTPFWRYTKTWHVNSAAFKLGVPLGAEVAFGGTGHPAFPARPGFDKKLNHMWLSKLSQLTRAELAMGTGLSVIPTGMTGLGRQLVRTELDRTESLQVPQGRDYIPALSEEPTMKKVKKVFRGPTTTTTLDNLLLSEAADSLAQIITTWEAYVRKPMKKLRTPRVVKTAQVLRQKIQKQQVLTRDLAYEPTLTDVMRKTMSYVRADAVQLLLPNTPAYSDGGSKLRVSDGTPRSYGLPTRNSAGEVVVRATAAQNIARHWDHLAGSRADRAYLRQAPIGVKTR